MLLALVGLVAVAALVVATMTWQRQARMARRILALEADVGRQVDEHVDPPVERPHRETVVGRVRALEVGRIVTEEMVTRLQRRLPPRR